MSDKIDMIYDLLKQDREDAAEFRKEVTASHKDTGERLAQLEASSQLQTQQLAEHMRRTEILEDLHGINATKIDNHENRIDELEKPRVVISTLKKWIIGFGAVAAAALAIVKFFGYF
jgi:hypothetical protein